MKRKKRNISYKKGKNKKRTRKKNMSGGGKLIHTWQHQTHPYKFVTDTGRPVLVTRPEIMKMQQIAGNSLLDGTTMNDEDFYSLWDLAKRQLEQNASGTAISDDDDISHILFNDETGQGQDSTMTTQDQMVIPGDDDISHFLFNDETGQGQDSTMTTQPVVITSTGGQSCPIAAPVERQQALDNLNIHISQGTVNAAIINANIKNQTCRLVLVVRSTQGGNFLDTVTLKNQILEAYNHSRTQAGYSPITLSYTFIPSRGPPTAIEVTPYTDGDGDYQVVNLGIDNLYFILLVDGKTPQTFWPPFSFTNIKYDGGGNPTINQQGVFALTEVNINPMTLSSFDPPIDVAIDTVNLKTISERPSTPTDLNKSWGQPVMTTTMNNIVSAYCAIPDSAIVFYNKAEELQQHFDADQTISTGGANALAGYIATASGIPVQLPPNVKNIQDKIAIQSRTITDITEDIGGRIPSVASLIVENVCSPYLVRFKRDGDGIHDTTSTNRCPVGRVNEIKKVQASFAINQTASLVYGLQEMLAYQQLLGTFFSPLSKDRCLVHRNLHQLLKLAKHTLAGRGKNGMAIGSTNDPKVKEMFRGCLADPNCMTTFLTACPRSYFSSGVARGVVLIHVYDQLNGPADTTLCNDILDFYKKMPTSIRAKKNSDMPFLDGPVGYNAPQMPRGGQTDKAFNTARFNLVSLISRFPPGGLFYGPIMKKLLVRATRSHNDLSQVDPKSKSDGSKNFPSPLGGTQGGGREPIAFTTSPPENYVCYEYERDRLMYLFISTLSGGGLFQEDPYLFFKSLLAMPATGALAKYPQIQCYRSPIPYSSAAINDTEQQQQQQTMSVNTLYMPLGVTGWSVNQNIFQNWSVDFQYDPPLITQTLQHNFRAYCEQNNAHIMAIFTLQQENMRVIVQKGETLLQQQRSQIQQMRQTHTILTEDQRADISNQEEVIVQTQRQHQSNVEKWEETRSIVAILHENDFELRFFREGFRDLQYNPFWSMILHTIQYPLASDAAGNASQQVAPFFSNPKNLITDQLPTADMVEILDSLSQYAVQEGSPCFASGGLNPSIYLPVLQSARFADHAPPTMAGNRNNRIDQTLKVAEITGWSDGIFGKLIDDSTGNPLYALKIATYEKSSAGYAQTVNLSVIQKREPFSLPNEIDPALLFGGLFTEMTRLNNCGATCGPCAETTSEGLLHTCIPNICGGRLVRGNPGRCDFSVGPGNASSCPLFKYKKATATDPIDSVGSKGAGNRFNTCLCDCYQEEYYEPTGALEGMAAKYQKRRASFCQQAQPLMLNYSANNMSFSDTFSNNSPMAHYTDYTLYHFVKGTKDSQDTPLKYKPFGTGEGKFKKKQSCLHQKLPL